MKFTFISFIQSISHKIQKIRKEDVFNADECSLVYIYKSSSDRTLIRKNLARMKARKKVTVLVYATYDDFRKQNHLFTGNSARPPSIKGKSGKDY